MVVGLLEVLEKFRVGGWHRRLYGVAQAVIWVAQAVIWWGGLFNYSVTPVQSLTVDFGLWTSTGLSLDNLF